MSEMLSLIFVIAAAGVAFAPLVMAIVALVRTADLRRELAAVRAELASMRRAAEPPAAPQTETLKAETPTAEKPAPPEAPPAPPRAAPAAAAPPPPTPPEPPEPPKERLEERLTSRWMVWLAGIVLALAFVFLFKYSIDKGLRGPIPRVLIGLLAGLAAIVGGEWLRRRPLARAVAAIRPDQIPPALAAAGIIGCFGAIYAAYALYDLIPPLLAFVALALVAAGAVLLSFGHGPLIAALGLLGAYLVPMLVATDAPSALGLFGYLLIVTGGGLAVVRYRDWWWLAWLGLAGALLWVFVWYLLAWQAGDAAVLGVYLPVLVALVVFARYGRAGAPGAPGGAEPSPWLLDRLPHGDKLVLAAAAATAFAAYLLVGQDDYGPVSLTAVAMLAALYLWIARREPRFDALVILAAALAVAVLAGWYLPGMVTLRRPFVLGAEQVGLMPGPMIPPELLPFAVAGAVFAAGFAAAGFALLWGVRRPALWAGVSAAVPIVILGIAYWRIEAFQVNLAWAVLALGLALLGLGAAAAVARFRGKPGMDAALGAYAVAVVAAVGLALTMSLAQAWLTVAVALMLPAIAWIHHRLAVAALRYVALILASAVLVRLVFNINLLDYPIGAVPGLNWMLYGYGIPAAAFFLAARWFARSADDRLVTTLETGALLFAVLLVSLEIRHLVGDGRLDRFGYGLLEQSLNSIAWAAAAYGLYRQHGRTPRLVALWGWRVLGGLAAAQVVVLQCLFFNPLWTEVDVWRAPVVNLLLLAYGMPAIFAALFARAARARGDARLAQATGILALVLVFIEITLEVRHAFLGPVLSLGATSEAEWYAYSVAWLVYAGLLLALGILRHLPELRYAALALIFLTVVKVLAWDTSALDDLYRVASVFVLALALFAVGYLYRRFVHPRPPAPAGPRKAAEGSG